MLNRFFLRMPLRPVLAAVLLLLTALGGCEPQCDCPPPASAATASQSVMVRMEYFTDRFTQEPFRLNTPYITYSDEPVQVREVKYYLSRVQLVRGDGQIWTSPVRAYLLDLGRQDSFYLPDVPPGEYVSMQFDIGLDSVTNSRTDWPDADLSPLNGMHWSWSTGYRFFSLDGNWLGASPPPLIEYHIGRAPTLRTVALEFNTLLRVNRGGPRQRVVLGVEPLRAFGPPHPMLLQLPAERNVMFDTPQARRVADNVSGMFSFRRVE